jgi:hypothetical protein
LKIVKVNADISGASSMDTAPAAFLQWLSSVLHSFSVVDFVLSIVAIVFLAAWRVSASKLESTEAAWRASASKLESTEVELNQYRSKLGKLQSEHQLELQKVKKELYKDLHAARAEQEKLMKLIEQKGLSNAGSMLQQIGEWIDRGFQALEFLSEITTEEDA